MSEQFKLPCGRYVTNNQVSYGTLQNLYTIDLEKGLICGKHFLNDLEITCGIEYLNDKFNFDIEIIYLIDHKDCFSDNTRKPFIKPIDVLKLISLSKSEHYIKQTRDLICNVIIPFIYKNRLKDNILVQTNTGLTPIIDMQPINENINIEPVAQNGESLTMSSLEIAKLCDKQHKDVLYDIRNMFEQLEINSAEFSAQYKDSTGRTLPCFNLDKELSLTLVAGYNVKLRHKIIQRWQELENQVVNKQPQLAIPQNLPEALRLAANLAEEKEELIHERDEAIRTKALISDKKTATALSKVGNLTLKVQRLEAKLKRVEPNYEYATVLAIQRRIKHIKVSGLKLTYYCRNNGLVMKDIPDERFGWVHSYPASAWKDVYQIDINTVLNREV